MATLAIVVFRLSPQDIVVASYVIRDLIMNTYRDKHRSGKVAVQGIHARSYCNEFVPFWATSSCTGKHGSYKSFETQIIPFVERITPWQEQNISVETQLVNPFCN